jgi:phosphoesterase RecJ-like protein
MTDPRQQIIDTLSRCRHVLVTTHVRPDGDALGTAAAMALALRKVGVSSDVLLLSHLPRKYAFIFDESGVGHRDVEAGWPVHFPFEDYDALLVVDTGTWSQLPGLQERIGNWNVPKLVLDHHLTQQNWADMKLVDTQAAAAGEIAADLLDLWKVPLDKAIASALFLAIASDTGWFQFSNTRPQTLRLAARLMEAGVETDRMYQALYQNERPERVALHTRGQQSMELLEGGRLAVMTLRKSDFDDTHAGVLDTENLINVPLQIRTVDVSMLVVGPTDPAAPVRVSLRSKGAVDVAAFAETLGGGGHARASGLKLDGTSLEQGRDRVVKAMTEWMRRHPPAVSQSSAGAV